jgi:K+-transporting ATPase ATPase A chain
VPLDIVALVVVLAIAWRYLGSYMTAVYEGRVGYLAWIERPVCRLVAVDPEAEQTWTRYAGALIVFSAMAILFT